MQLPSVVRKLRLRLSAILRTLECVRETASSRANEYTKQSISWTSPGECFTKYVGNAADRHLLFYVHVLSFEHQQKAVTLMG